MSKTIVSPVKRWPGEVVLYDPLNFPQVFAIEETIEAIQKDKDTISDSKAAYMWLPTILKCVEKWNLQGGFPELPAPDNWPTTPALSRRRLIAWLVSEIMELFKETEEIPNA